jgi:hypothetical protein
MVEKDKGFSFRSLFFRDDSSETQEKQTQETEPASNKPQENYAIISNSYQPAGNQDQPLVEDFVQRLQNLINQNNQPGFDFIDFTESLFEEKQNPSPEVYKTVFRIAQKMDKSLTASRLIESAMFYKDLVQRTTETEVSKGETKKQGLLAEKETERNTLDSNLRDTKTRIEQLSRQIQDLQNQELTLNNQLLAIDQKYGNQLIEIDRKITAIRNAKDQVLVSIVDIEAGIKSNLS